MSALDTLLLILVPIVVFRISYGLARGRLPEKAARKGPAKSVPRGWRPKRTKAKKR